jgi:hypothetical protein
LVTVVFALAAWLSVKVVPLSTVPTVTVPAGMPWPAMGVPALRLVGGVKVIVVLPEVTLPVRV